MKKKYTQHELDTMCNNLYWKLRKSVLYHGSHSCVTISYLFDKVRRYAPKAIKESGILTRNVVVMLWNVDHDYSVEDCEMAVADLNDCMLEYFTV